MSWRLSIIIDYEEVLIDPMDILYLLAGRMYTTIVLKCGTKYCVSKCLKSYLSLLKHTKLFVRIHKSHGVNKSNVEKVTKGRTHVEMIDGTLLPIAKRCRDKVKNLF